MAANAIAAVGVPVLCIDTCSIYDLMRDPTRDTMRVDHRESGLALLTAAEAGQLHGFIPEQVSIEFAVRDQQIQDEAKQKLAEVRKQMAHINALAALYGAPSTVDLSHLDDHVARARGIVGRWLTQLQVVIPSAHAPGKAFARVNAGIAPAKRGKDSSKDCLIYETVLEHVAALRAAGTATPIVFLSSNVTEYYTEGSKLKPGIAAEFAALNLIFAPNMGAAKHELGL